MDNDASVESRPTTRRELLRSAAAAGAVLTGAMSLRAADGARESRDEPPPKSGAEAFERLKAGNLRFVAGKTVHAHQSANWRAMLRGEQHPFATILGCSDSRVPVELVFDQGFGDLFVIRVAGNVFSPAVLGSIEYAVAHLQTKLLVVLGHERCGAVTAALQALIERDKEPPGMRGLLKLIEPGIPKELPRGTPEERLGAAIEANVRWTMKQVAAVPLVKKGFDDSKTVLVGGVYELSAGKVKFLSD
jgi:carbonic anhydrase